MNLNFWADLKINSWKSKIKDKSIFHGQIILNCYRALCFALRHYAIYRGVPSAAAWKLFASGGQGAGAGHKQPSEFDWGDGQPGPDQQLSGIRVSKGHFVSGQQYCGAPQQKVAPFHRST